MNAIQQKCRPKHQVLVLKCYPKTTKGAVDVKPNSSELSYLLFYATSRRSKIQKVGAFLEKKTASDAWRLRIGNVQVTLQILVALIENSPKDMPLFAPYVLKILDVVLRSDDITMIESSLPTFATFCEHNDASSLQADQTYLQQYESVIRAYATLASTRHSPPGKLTPTKPVAIRWRKAGLQAIKSLASSLALSSVSALELHAMVPMILENLWTDNEEFLDVLLHRAQSDKVDPDKMLKRRNSVATVRTVETTGDTNPIALSGSAGDVDKLAEEDIGVLAMQCLKQVFVVPNRPRIHGATTALLIFIEQRVAQDEIVVKRHPHTCRDHGWAIKILGLITSWAPVQDRYAILVTIMENMMPLPVTDETLRQHLVTAAMVRSLLRSDVNLIGLSVMDVLLGLIALIKRVILLSGGRSDFPEHSGDETEPSTVSLRNELLERIQECIGDLATHVYYVDQISDMISTILARIRQAPPVNTATSSPAEEPAEGQGTSASNSNMADSQQLDVDLTLNIGKISALRAIKAILLVANPSTKMSGNVSLLRNRVPLSVWEGTHWLLRDPDGLVRKAYADAMVTWLDRETTPKDLKARDEDPNGRNSSAKNGKELAATARSSARPVTRRAASGMSGREKSIRPSSHSHFLQLIHIAIYDSALQFVDCEGDVLLLHILLAKLTLRFGVNAVRYGLPMVFRLQEDIQDAETPISKVRIGSLVHGYFWTLTECFDFDGSAVGRAVHNEIIRRRSKGFWVEGVRVPPLPVDNHLTPGVERPPPKMPIREIESESLLPFDDRVALFECIADGYQGHSSSPPSSPSGTSGRQFFHSMSPGAGAVSALSDDQALPVKMREDILALDWSRESAILSIQEGSKSASLSGSRSGTTAFTHRGLLAANGSTANGYSPTGPSSPVHSAHNRPGSRPDAAFPGRERNASVRSGMSGSPGSASSRGYVTTVEQLKMVLAGGQLSSMHLPANLMAGDDTGSESMASFDYTPSELSFNPVSGQADRATTATASARKDSPAEYFGPLNSNPLEEPGAPLVQTVASEEEKDVPPVPPLPANFSLPKKPAATVSATEHGPSPPHTHPTAPGTARSMSVGRRSLKSRGGSVPRAAYADAISNAMPAMDLQAMLQGIDSHAGESTLSGITKPPY